MTQVTTPIRVLLSADPAAGAELTYTAPFDMIIHSLRFTFVTSATVANRFPSLVADDGTNQFFRFRDAGARTAGATYEYCFSEGNFSNSIDAGFPLPAQGLRLRKGDRLRSVTTNIDAGDNYGPLILQITE